MSRMRTTLPLVAWGVLGNGGTDPSIHFIGTRDAVNFKVKTNNVERMVFESGGNIVINETGADSDFRIEGDTDDHLFFLEAGTDRVGIGTSGPDAKFEVKGLKTDEVTFRVKAVGSQTVDVVNFQNNLGVQSFRMNSGGTFAMGGAINASSTLVVYGKTVTNGIAVLGTHAASTRIGSLLGVFGQVSTDSGSGNTNVNAIGVAGRGVLNRDINNGSSNVFSAQGCQSLVITNMEIQGTSTGCTVSNWGSVPFLVTTVKHTAASQTNAVEAYGTTCVIIHADEIDASGGTFNSTVYGGNINIISTHTETDGTLNAVDAGYRVNMATSGTSTNKTGYGFWLETITGYDLALGLFIEDSTLNNTIEGNLKVGNVLEYQDKFDSGIMDMMAA